ncbi:MAG: hypothetical protein ACRDA9_16605, partial [Plesiomonas shigelloides]
MSVGNADLPYPFSLFLFSIPFLYSFSLFLFSIPFINSFSVSHIPLIPASGLASANPESAS